MHFQNLHKWCFCPAGSAFLWARNRVVLSSGKPALHHPLVSHSHNHGFSIEAAFTGTKDYSAFWVIPFVMEFVENEFGGFETIRARNHSLIWRAATDLAKAWGTDIGLPQSMTGSMSLVGLPLSLGSTL